jgi:hypothetical protein
MPDNSEVQPPRKPSRQSAALVFFDEAFDEALT